MGEGGKMCEEKWIKLSSPVGWFFGLGHSQKIMRKLLKIFKKI